MTFAVDVCLVVTLEQTSEGSRSGLLAKCFLGSLGYQGQKTTLFAENAGLLALPPSAARPINQSFPEQAWFLGLVTPGLQKTTWPKKHYGIPLSEYMISAYVSE